MALPQGMTLGPRFTLTSQFTVHAAVGRLAPIYQSGQAAQPSPVHIAGWKGSSTYTAAPINVAMMDHFGEPQCLRFGTVAPLTLVPDVASTHNEEFLSVGGSYMAIPDSWIVSNLLARLPDVVRVATNDHPNPSIHSRTPLIIERESDTLLAPQAFAELAPGLSLHLLVAG
jgi:hypothetical protein